MQRCVIIYSWDSDLPVCWLLSFHSEVFQGSKCSLATLPCLISETRNFLKPLSSPTAVKPRGSKNPNGSVAPNCSDGWNGGGVAGSAACAECTNISLKVRTWDVQNVQMDLLSIQILDSRMLRHAVNIPNWFLVRWFSYGLGAFPNIERKKESCILPLPSLPGQLTWPVPGWGTAEVRQPV